MQGDFERVPGQDLPLSHRTMWEAIKSNEDLDLPAHKVMVATVRCGQIMENLCSRFAHDESVVELQTGARSAIVADFGTRSSALVQRYLEDYDSAVCT